MYIIIIKNTKYKRYVYFNILYLPNPQIILLINEIHFKQVYHRNF